MRVMGFRVIALDIEAETIHRQRADGGLDPQIGVVEIMLGPRLFGPGVEHFLLGIENIKRRARADAVFDIDPVQGFGCRLNLGVVSFQGCQRSAIGLGGILGLFDGLVARIFQLHTALAGGLLGGARPGVIRAGPVERHRDLHQDLRGVLAARQCAALAVRVCRVADQVNLWQETAATEIDVGIGGIGRVTRGDDGRAFIKSLLADGVRPRS